MPTPRPLDEVQIQTAFDRFRWASIAEGIALLILVVIMVMRYGVYGGDGLFTSTSETWDSISSVWSPIHGLIYIIYVVFSFDLWLKMRWGMSRMLLLMFYGVIPILSFIGERLTRQKVDADLRRRPTLQDQERAAGAAGP
ncbi:MAG: DUF3817 domain-containing protein [Brachybacterium sp.]|nr:DUF3817 domain-containing protein [Brachybacterium sp.]